MANIGEVGILSHLSIKWPRDSNDLHLSDNGLDFIYIHGLHDETFDSIKKDSTAPTSPEWLDEYCQSISNSRLLNFNYDAVAILAGDLTREAIHQVSVDLLEKLVGLRGKESTRATVILAHDIGGIIMKYALQFAMLDGSRWGNLTYYSRILIFQDCPHRSLDAIDLRERLTLFLLGNRNPNVHPLSPSISAVAGLARAVTEINGIFIESKVYIHTYLASVYSQKSKVVAPVYHSFDEFTGTMGIPFETTFCEEGSEESMGSVLKGYIDRETPYFASLTPNSVNLDMILASLASPINQFTSTPSSTHFINEIDEIRDWIRKPANKIMYIHGADTAEVSEQLFFAIKDHQKTDIRQRHFNLYFDFDRHDDRRNTLRNIISTFLAQMICHNHSSDMEVFANMMFEELSQEQGLTDNDLFFYFQKLHQYTSIASISLVLNNFDGCTPSSQTSILDMLSKMTHGKDWHCLIAILDAQPQMESSDRSNLKLFDLKENRRPPTGDDVIASEISRFLRSRPEMSIQRSQLKDYLNKNTCWKSASGEIILGQWKVQSKCSFGALCGDISQLSHLSECDRLTHTVDQVLRRIPDQQRARALLIWVLFTVRPLTIWELAIATATDLELELELGFKAADVDSRSSNTDELVIQVETWFAGILKIQNNEVQIVNEQIRSVLMGAGDGPTGPYFWKDMRDIAHFRISRTCLNYVQYSKIHSTHTHLQIPSAYDHMQLPTILRRYDLMLYATLHWATHYLKHPTPEELPINFEAFFESDSSPQWAGVLWSLSNPITRPRRPFKTASSALASLGVSHRHIKTLNIADVDTLFEASRRLDSSIVIEILKTHDWPMDSLLQALIGASTSANENLAVQIVDFIQAKSPDSAFQWPAKLLRSASRLNLVTLLQKLIELGAYEQFALNKRSSDISSPLFQAAQSNAVDCLVTLLDCGADFQERSNLCGKNRTVLHEIVGMNGTEAAEALLGRFQDLLELEDNNGATALQLAVNWGLYKMVECLLEFGADPNLRSRDLNTFPLASAAVNGYVECARLLLSRGADVNIAGPDGGYTPLFYAVLHGHTTICRMLLENGADPNHDLSGTSILSRLLKNDKSLPLPTVESILNLLLEFGADPNCVDELGKTPLIHAILSRHESLVEQLLKKGADPNKRCNGNSYLINAISVFDDINVVKLLVDHDADLESGNSQGISPLGFAAALGKTAAVKFLLDKKAAIESEAVSFRRFTPVCFAAQFGFHEILRILANAEADLKHCVDDGSCPLHLASTPDSLRSLLEFRARIDIGVTNILGETPLAYAVRNGHTLESIGILINAGVMMNSCDRRGRTALMEAIIRRDDEIITLLLKQRDTEVNIASSASGSALHFACKRGAFESMKQLVERGADVNLAVPGLGGTPLQSTCQFSGWDNLGSGPIRLEYLLSNGADPMTTGGQLGSLMSAAAAFTPPSISRLLLSRGAPVNVYNKQGSMPIHFAASHGIDNLLVLVEEEVSTESRDFIHRTPLHCAAQDGRLRVVEYLLQTNGSSAVHEADIDGWTPLHWAARGCNRSFFPSFAGEEPNHLGVIKSLLQHGADTGRAVSIAEEEWLPFRLACYSGASVETAKALKPHDRGRLTDVETKAGRTSAIACDSCYWMIRGSMFDCRTCIDYYLCPKCYTRRDITHAPHVDHQFIQSGEPFAPDADWKPLLEELNAEYETDSDGSSDESTSDSEVDFGRARRAMRATLT